MNSNTHTHTPVHNQVSIIVAYAGPHVPEVSVGGLRVRPENFSNPARQGKTMSTWRRVHILVLTFKSSLTPFGRSWSWWDAWEAEPENWNPLEALGERGHQTGSFRQSLRSRKIKHKGGKVTVCSSRGWCVSGNNPVGKTKKAQNSIHNSPGPLLLFRIVQHTSIRETEAVKSQVTGAILVTPSW